MSFTTTQVQTVMSRVGDTVTTLETIINVNINLKQKEVLTNVTEFYIVPAVVPADPYFSNM